MRAVPCVLHDAIGRQILGSSFRGVAGAHGVTRELPDELVGILLCLTPDLRQRPNPRLDDSRHAARREPAGDQQLQLSVEQKVSGPAFSPAAFAHRSTAPQTKERQSGESPR